MEQNNPQKGKRNAAIIMAVAGIVIILLIVWKVSSNKTQPQVQSTTTTTHATSSVEGIATTSPFAPKTVHVSLTDSGYSPETVNVNVGDSVIFTNNSQDRMWTASDPYPTNTGYPGFDEKSAAVSGKSYTFTFNKVGTWPYHNQLNTADTGTVVVASNGSTKD